MDNYIGQKQRIIPEGVEKSLIREIKFPRKFLPLRYIKCELLRQGGFSQAPYKTKIDIKMLICVLKSILLVVLGCRDVGVGVWGCVWSHAGGASL